MSKYIGRRINVGFGIEGVRGTPVDVQAFVPKTDFSFEESMEVTIDESSRGSIADSSDSFVARRLGQGEIGGNIAVNNFGYLLLATLGEVSTELDTTGAYKHTFTLKETNTTQSLTTGVNDPVLGDLSFPLTSIESLTISAETGEYISFTANIKSKQGVSASHTVTYDTDYLLRSFDSVFKVADNLAGLESASAVCLRSFEATFTKNLEDDYCLSSNNPADFINQAFSIEGSFTAVFTNDTFRDYALEGEKKAISFKMIDEDQTIGATSNPTLTVTLPYCSFTEFSRTQGNDETVTQTLNFKAHYSQVDDSVGSVELVNTKEEYVYES